MEYFEINPNNLPPCLESDENITLWRYMSFSSLCEILMYNYIPLIRATEFNDKSEGIVLSSILRKFPNTIPEMVEFTFDICLKSTFISSWYCSEYENSAMWDRYTHGGEGVVVKTNAKKLMDCIEAGSVDNVIWDKSRKSVKHDVIIKHIEYTSLKPSDFKMDYDIFMQGYDKMCFFFKMMEFKDESEVRILRPLYSNLHTIASINADKNLIRSLLEKYQNQKSARLPINSASALIQQVVVSPYAHDNFIRIVYDLIPHIIKLASSNENHGQSKFEDSLSGLPFDVVQSNRKQWF